jgi:hypothetical protein
VGQGRATSGYKALRGARMSLNGLGGAKDDCSGKGLKIWLENLRNLILTLQVHFNLVVYLLLDSSASASASDIKSRRFSSLTQASTNLTESKCSVCTK